jgi:opacity protein-like surface antigen
MLRFIKLFFIAALPLIMISNANAHEDTIIGSGFYARLSAGAFMPTDTGYSVSGSRTGAGLTATGTVSGDIKTDIGQAFYGAMGHKLNKFISIEGELGYVSAGLDSASVDIAGTVTSGGNSLVVDESTDIDVNGDVSALSGMVNLIIHPSRWKKYLPYFGMGLGFVNWEREINSISQNGITLPIINEKVDGTDLAAQFIAGIDMNLRDNISAGIRYQYVWTDTGDDFLDDVTANIIQASIRIRF